MEKIRATINGRQCTVLSRQYDEHEGKYYVYIKRDGDDFMIFTDEDEIEYINDDKYEKED